MPPPLWAAVALAAEHGIDPIARALRLNYETLKVRVGRRAAGERTGGMIQSPRSRSEK